LAFGLRLGVSDGLGTSDGLGVDASAFRLGLGTSGGLGVNASAFGLQLGVSNRLGIPDGLGVDASAFGLRLGVCGLSIQDGLGVDASAFGLELGVSNRSVSQTDSESMPRRLDSGSAFRAEDLAQFPYRLLPAGIIFGEGLERSPTGSGWEEEPIDSADPVSYREAIAHPRHGQKWSDAVDEELRSLAENSTWD